MTQKEKSNQESFKVSGDEMLNKISRPGNELHDHS
jgi:hypothetical protein